MSEQQVSVEKLQELISRGPFNKWLNFTVLQRKGVGSLYFPPGRKDSRPLFASAYQHAGVFFLDQFSLAGTSKVDRERLRTLAASAVTQ